MGPNEFRRIFSGQVSDEEIDAIVSYGSAENVGSTGTSDAQRPVCPGGDTPEVDPLILPFRGTVRAT